MQTWEERTSSGQFSQYAAEAPHVNGQTIARAQYHLGRTVEARLNVRVDALMLVTTWTKVDHLDRPQHTDPSYVIRTEVQGLLSPQI